MPQPESLDAWINHELPQVISAWRSTHPKHKPWEPDAEFGSFQTFRRYVEGWPLAKMIAHEKGEPEPIEPAPQSSAKIAGRLQADGRMLRNDAGIYRPVWSSALAILKKAHEPFLDWLVATGFNGCRVFAGALGWAGQSAADAVDALPRFLEACAARGLYCEVTALTDTKDGAYNPRGHVRAIGEICGAHENALVELANEPWHPTQSDLTPTFLASLMSVVPAGVLVALGAADSDESDEYAGGHYVTAHLDRGRDEWNMVRRVRELEALSDKTRKFVLNNEPIKAGSQNANPSIYFTMALLNRLFEVGGVFHSDEGLQGVPPAPGSRGQELADAFIEGSRLITSNERVNYQNTGWTTSPIKSFTGAVRLYSGITSDRPFVCALGIDGGFGVETQNGWSLGSVIAERPNVRVYELTR